MAFEPIDTAASIHALVPASKQGTSAKPLNRLDSVLGAQVGAEVRPDARARVHAVALVSSLPPIPAKRYFTIGEVSELCGVKPYVLRYWEQEFSQLRPMKRRGNRRYYQHHEVLLVRRIRELLYEQGFTISGARNQLSDGAGNTFKASEVAAPLTASDAALLDAPLWQGPDLSMLCSQHPKVAKELREALVSIRHLLD